MRFFNDLKYILKDILTNQYAKSICSDVELAKRKEVYNRRRDYNYLGFLGNTKCYYR